MKDETLDKGWEDRFNEKIGNNLKHQKARLYSEGVYSQGREKDWESAEQEVEQIKQFITNLLAEQKAEIIKSVENAPIHKAHTYASENADIYRAYDAGQERMKKDVLNIIKE